MSWLEQIPTVAELREAADNLSEEIGKHDRHEHTYREMLSELREETARREQELHLGPLMLGFDPGENR